MIHLTCDVLVANIIIMVTASSSCDSEDLEDETSSSDEENPKLKGCYLNEPEYTLEEIEKFNSTVETSKNEESSNDEFNSSRLEILHWCKCSNCVIFQEMSLVECKCCREYESILSEKLEGIKCITLHQEFEVLCQNKIILGTAYIQHRRYQNKFTDLKTFCNK